jgi:Fe-S-cluster containining protein
MRQLLKLYRSYEEHAADVEAEFRRVAARFSDRMQCRRGCSMCCGQMFAISAIEAAYVSRAVKALPAPRREALRGAARDYVAAAARLGVARTGDDGEDSVAPRPGVRLTCPALVDDACSIYEARPLICRRWGIPLFDPRRPEALHACELNFRPGEEIDAGGLLDPQVALLETWVALKARVRDELGQPRIRTTVAEAILNDYDTMLAGPARQGGRAVQRGHLP